MSGPRWLLAGLTLAALASASACVFGCEFPGPLPGVEVELGVDEDLHAIAWAAFQGDYEHVAVGDAGTIVAWSPDRSSSPVVDVFDIGDASLRAIWIDENARSIGEWWVAGDGGTVALSVDAGQSWTVESLGDGSASLHAITPWLPSRPIVVGDEAVFVRRADGTWGQAQAPKGVWGQLRGVAFDGERVYAVGLGGAAWSSNDPLGFWVAEELGVDVDLHDLARWSEYRPELLVAVGAEGTMLIHEDGEWRTLPTDLDEELIDYDEGRFLARGGHVYEVDVFGFYRGQGSPQLVDAIAQARALDSQLYIGNATVGEGGHATVPQAYWDCE